WRQGNRRTAGSQVGAGAGASSGRGGVWVLRPFGDRRQMAELPLFPLMQWYYAIDGQRQGPVSEHEFARLVAAGTITGDTLVWRQGLEEWAPWSTLADSHPLPD